MFRKLTLLLSLVLAMGFAITSTAAAQDATAEGELEGLETGYARMYMPDFMAMIAAATPGAEFEIDEDGVTMIMIAGFTFDNEDNANKAMDTVSEGMTSDMSAAEDIDVSDVDDLGDKAILISGVSEEAVDPMVSNTLIVLDGENLYSILTTGGDLEASAQQAQDIAQHMLDGEIETEEVTFSEDGTSTGGVFDLMPDAEEDAELLGNLPPSMDMDMNDPGAGL